MAISALTPSTIAASITCPWPERSRSYSAARTPMTRKSEPPPRSPTRFSGASGFEPLRPIMASAPVIDR
jgi:hypothetical protein